jgi:hypothetical protein
VVYIQWCLSHNPLSRQFIVAKIHTEVGYDSAKPIKGRKRHILVDTLGLLIVVVVTAANMPERAGAKIVFAKVKKVQADSERLKNRLGASWKSSMPRSNSMTSVRRLGIV